MESLENVKVGDKVVRSNNLRRTIETVTKVTKTQIHIGYNKFRKSDGRLITSDRWNSNRIDVLTESLYDDIKTDNEKKKMVSYFDKYNFHLLTYDEMVNVYKLLKELEK